MKTQAEQIKSATRAYLLPLNKQQSRFQVYLLIDGRLSCLWPWHDKHGNECESSSTARALLTHQICSSNANLPAFHFYLKGYNYSKKSEIRDVLQSYNPAIIVEALTGWEPQAQLT